MYMLQEAAAAAGNPSISEWRAILLLMGGGISVVFGGLTLTQRGRVEDLKEQVAALRAEKIAEEAAHERALQTERDRTARAEKTADDAMARHASTLSVVAEQTAAIREFGAIVKEATSESRRSQERLDLVARTTEDIRRELASRPWGPRPPEAPTSGD